MSEKILYRILPLGDNALIIDFGNLIEESINNKVLALFHHFKSDPLPGMIETVPAYSSITIYYDVLFIKKNHNPSSTAFEWVSHEVEKVLSRDIKDASAEVSLVRVPVCYEKEFGPDLESIAERNKISVEEIIQLHTSIVYRVYMLGFLPGFAYMAMVDNKIISPRKKEPVPVEAGSVGIAGKQTGIYPLRSPGGWQIIGRTPLQLFNKNKEQTTLFNPGDSVQFYSINKNEFEDIKSRNA